VWTKLGIVSVDGSTLTRENGGRYGEEPSKIDYAVVAL
jgi:hypothetical protein